MTFKDYLNDIFAPVFGACADWFQKIFDGAGLLGVFLGMVILVIAFSALVMPFVSFGGLRAVQTGRADLERKLERDYRDERSEWYFKDRGQVWKYRGRPPVSRKHR